MKRLLLALALLCVFLPMTGCYRMRTTSFPRMVWYWSQPARIDREEVRSEKAFEQALHQQALTNRPAR